MGLFGKMFGNSNEAPARLIMLANSMASKIIFDKNQISKGAIFEALLFSSLRILNKFEQKRPNLYSKFEADYFKEMYLYAKEEGILYQIPGDFGVFVNNRFQLYDQQLNSMRRNSEEEGRGVPTKIAYNFYEKPLTKDSGDNLDLSIILSLTSRMAHLFQALDSAVDLVIKENNL